jgi:hypothetical protein
MLGGVKPLEYSQDTPAAESESKKHGQGVGRLTIELCLSLYSTRPQIFDTSTRDMVRPLIVLPTRVPSIFIDKNVTIDLIPPVLHR